MNALLIGNVAGYLVAYLLYGQLLPLLSGPAITGALIGGAVGLFGRPLVLTVTWWITDLARQPRGNALMSENPPTRQELQEQKRREYASFLEGHAEPGDLVDAINDEDSRVRTLASQAIIETRDVAAIEPLIAALKTDVGVCGSQESVGRIKVLGEIGDQRALAPLLHVFKNASDPGVRKAAGAAITKIKKSSLN